MSWIAVAVGTGAGAGLKYLEGQQAQKQDQAKMMANAAQIQYSPWTHANAQVIGSSAGSPTTAALDGALQGGLSGAMFAKANPQLMGGGSNAATANNMNVAGDVGANSLNGQQMGQELGYMGSHFDNQIGQAMPKQTFFAQNSFKPSWK